MKQDIIVKKLAKHVKQLKECRCCPHMIPPVVSGGPVVSKVLLVGQAPGDKEPKLGRPFAWTAGRRLFKWFNEAIGITEEQFRASVYMAAVCRCFPGKKLGGGDRVPSLEEIQNCSSWLNREIEILQPELIIPVGQLAISQFLPKEKLEHLIGRVFSLTRDKYCFDVIPLPHPSGANPWPSKESGKALTKKALRRIVKHPAFIVEK